MKTGKYIGSIGGLGLGLLLSSVGLSVDLPLPCKENAGSAPGGALLRSCASTSEQQGLSEEIAQKVDTLISRRISDLAAGLDYDFELARTPSSKTPARPFPTPSCNLMDASGQRGASCGDLAKLEIHGESLRVKLGNQSDGTAAGSREMAYLRGVYLQSLSCQKSAVLSEIRSNNKIAVRSSKCSAPIPGVQANLQKFMSTSGALSTDNVDLDGLNLACEDDSTSVSGGNAQHRQAGCQLKAAREMLEAQVAYVAACEISARAGELYDGFPLNLARNPTGFENTLKNGIYGIESLGQYCERAARNAAGLRCREGCVENLINRCYSGTREPAFERKGGIEVFFKDVMQKYFQNNQCQNTSALERPRPVFAGNPLFFLLFLITFVGPLLGGCSNHNGGVELNARCTSPSGEVFTGWREAVCCDSSQTTERSTSETFVQAYVTVWKFGPEDHDIAKIYFPSGTKDGVETPIDRTYLDAVKEQKPDKVKEYKSSEEIRNASNTSRAWIVFRKEDKRGHSAVLPTSFPDTCTASATVTQSQWEDSYNWKENKARQVQLNTCANEGDSTCVTDPDARGTSFTPSVLATYTSSISCIAVTSTITVKFDELAWREPSPNVAEAKALSSSAGYRVVSLNSLNENASACIDNNGSGNLFEDGIGSNVNGLNDTARTAIELAQSYYDGRSEYSDYASSGTTSAATASNGPGNTHSGSGNTDPLALLKGLENLGSGGGGGGARSPSSSSSGSPFSSGDSTDTGTVTTAASGDKDSLSESSAAYAGGGGGGRRGKSSNSSLNPLGALSSLFGGGKDGKTGAGANGKDLDFGAAAGSTEDALMNMDAEDYFARLSPDQNLFQVVHRRYRKENVRWVSSDLKAP